MASAWSSLMANTYVSLTIDEYLRERLMPVEGVIPHVPGIEMYGNSIPAGTVGGDLFEYINFQQARGRATFGGGIPLKDADGTVIGAIGVSGSTEDNDVKVANAAVEACNGRKFATA